MSTSSPPPSSLSPLPPGNGTSPPASSTVPISPPVTAPPPPHHGNPYGGGGSTSNYSGGSEPPLPRLSPLGFPKNTFSLEELAMATDWFSDANLLGRGALGCVHKGVLPDGKEVAVKQLNKVGCWRRERELLTKLKMMSRAHHPNLVPLVGCCIAGEQRMLVHEFVSNNTLEYHLHGNCNVPSSSKRTALPWVVRLDIAVSVARGLAYLHGLIPPVIWGNVKSANIHLDEDFNAKLSDFGETRVLTNGYIVPEYNHTGFLTLASDVYCFGVVLLELLTGCRAVDKTRCPGEQRLVLWTMDHLGDPNKLSNIMDSRLKGQYPRKSAFGVSYIAMKCVNSNENQRPPMYEIYEALLEMGR